MQQENANGNEGTTETSDRGGNQEENTKANSGMGVVYGKYWRSMTKELSLTFLSIGRNYLFVKNILIREYPSFRERMESVLRRLLQSTESRAKLAHTTPIGGTKVEHDFMMRATRPFLKVYLSRSSARIQEALHLMGVQPPTKHTNHTNHNNHNHNSSSGGGGKGNYNLSIAVPSKKDILTYVECIRHELRSVRHDVELTNHVTKMIVASIVRFQNYLNTCHCENQEIWNYDKTTFGAAGAVTHQSTGTSYAFFFFSICYCNNYVGCTRGSNVSPPPFSLY